jgi:hypothetical protein
VGTLSVSGTVKDPARRYLPRRFELEAALPRNPATGEPLPVNSLFRALEVLLYPSPAASVGANWALVRAAVENKDTKKELAGALIRVLRNGAEPPLARGVSDQRGEALVAVPGVPRITWQESGESVLVSEIEATLEVVFDKDAGAVVDPDRLEKQRQTLIVTRFPPIKLAAGRPVTASLPVKVS